MKKTSSFNLEESTYDEIIQYKLKHKLTSRNAALEMMLTERRTILKMLDNKICFQNEELEDKKVEKSEPDIFNDSIKDSFSSMPD